jgi:hypothetical protein
VQTLENAMSTGSVSDTDLKFWRERLKKAEEAEGRAWEELSGTPFFQSISRQDLSDFEQGEFLAGLVRCKPVERAWLVRKNLTEFSYRRCYILFVELPGMEDEDRYELCRSLERTLDLPGQVLVLWAGYSPTLEEIQQYAFDPVYVRPLG